MSTAAHHPELANDPIRSLPAQVGPLAVTNIQKETDQMLIEQSIPDQLSGNPETHPAWCDHTTDHAPADGGQWHIRKLGLIPTIENDLRAEEDPRPNAPLEIEVSTTDGDPAAHAVLAIQGWCEAVVLDLDGVRRARDLFAEAARLLGDDDGFDAAAAQALALVGGGR